MSAHTKAARAATRKALFTKARVRDYGPNYVGGTPTSWTNLVNAHERAVAADELDARAFSSAFAPNFR